MESLLYFLLWALIFYFAMTRGCSARAGGQQHGREQRETPDNGEPYWEPPVKDRDPVCRKTIFTHSAKSSVYKAKAYYFCSRECREVFEAAPGIYLSEPSAPAAASEENAHV